MDERIDRQWWRSGATTNPINALADQHKIQLYETPVGFKYIGELIIKDEIAIGGEESAGLTIRGHLPEKDGVIAGLLIAEMVATRGKSLGTQLRSYLPELVPTTPFGRTFT